MSPSDPAEVHMRPRSTGRLALVAISLLVAALVPALRLLEARARPGGPITPPGARAGRPWAAADSAGVLLGIDRFGQYYVGRRAIPNAALSAVLDSAFRGRPPGTPLELYADRALPVGALDAALAVARARSVQRVALVVDPPDGQ